MSDELKPCPCCGYSGAGADTDGKGNRMNPQDEALKDCAHCGGKPDMYRSGVNDWHVYCEICDVQTARMGSESAAASVWNTRLSHSTPGDAEGVLTAALNQNDAMRQELTHVGNLVSDLARAMNVDVADDDGTWPDLAGHIEKLKVAARSSSSAQSGDAEVRRENEALKAELSELKSRMYREITLHGRITETALAQPPAAEPVVKPRPYPYAVDGMKYSETLVVEGASLTIHTSGHADKEGRGYFCFREDECEHEYGENGKSYWISYTTNSELIALRDKLNDIFPDAPAEPWQCSARKQGATGGNEPADCDWPFCGCDLAAAKVIEAIEESGRLATPSGRAQGEVAEVSDCLTLDEAWHDLINKDDRTSPEEYPDMCLITRDELDEYMRGAVAQYRLYAAPPAQDQTKGDEA